VRFAEEVGRRAALTIDAVYSHRMIGAREEVLATVSHDLRNPLGTILSSAEVLSQLARSDASGDALRKQASVIHRSARRMERLITDLLDPAQIEAGKLAMERQAIDARPLLQMAKQGAGLGLFITKGIIEAHGGKIWIESEPGTGATFRFTVPNATATESNAA